jgi:hypothetical protein
MHGLTVPLPVPDVDPLPWVREVLPIEWVPTPDDEPDTPDVVPLPVLMPVPIPLPPVPLPLPEAPPPDDVEVEPVVVPVLPTDIVDCVPLPRPVTGMIVSPPV